MSQQLLFSLRGHINACSSLSFNPFPVTTDEGDSTCTENLLASGDDLGNLFVWNVKTRRQLSVSGTASIRNRVLAEAQVNEKEKKNASGKREETTNESQPQHHSAGIINLHWIQRPQGEMGKEETILISQGRDNALKFWKLGGSTRILESLSDTLQDLPIESLHFCRFACTTLLPPSGQTLLAFCLANPPRIAVYNVFKVEILFRNLESKRGACTSLAFNPRWNGKDSGSGVEDASVLAGYEDGSIVIHHPSTTTNGLELNEVLPDKHGEPVLSLTICNETGLIISSGADDLIIFHSSDDHSYLSHTVKILTPGVACTSIIPTTTIVAICCWDGSIRLYDFKERTFLNGEEGMREHRKALRCCTSSILSSSSKNEGVGKDLTVFVGSEDARISVWKINNPK